MNTYEYMRVLGERSNRVERLYYKWARAHGFSYNVLAVLYVACKDTHCTQKNVCEQWSLPKQTVNTVCKDLCAKGYLTLQRSTQDGRETCLVLTEEGQNLARPVVDELIKVESMILDSLGDESMKQLLTLFNRFCDEAELRLGNSSQALSDEE